MTSNFLLNNLITYRDRRLKGAGLITGLLAFYAACSVGAVVAVRTAEMMVQLGIHWFIAGAAGTVIASIWNYTVTQFFIWRTDRRARLRRRSAGIH